MPADLRIIDPASARLDALRDAVVAVLGYGAQGHAHALNLRDSGLNVLVAQRPGSPRHAAALADGFTPVSVAQAARQADFLIFALPDDRAGPIFESDVRPHLRPRQTLGFIDGFCVVYRQVQPPADVDVVMVSPKSQGRGVRSEFLAGRGPLALVGVHQDATGRARERMLAWAAGIGAHRAGLLETTLQDETEADMFGEQAVICGGLTAVIQTGFETLVEAGYPPELAYLECCHEMKILTDLIYERGIRGMREKISSTARYGDLTRGPLLAAAVRDAMRAILADVRSGAFAREFLADSAAGGTLAQAALEAQGAHPIETVGDRLRAMIAGRGPAPE